MDTRTTTASARIASRLPTELERIQARLGLYDRDKTLTAINALREQQERCRLNKKRIPKGGRARAIVLAIYHSL